MIKVSHIDPALYARLKGHTQSKSRLSAPEKLAAMIPMGWITNKMAMDVVKITTALIDSRVLKQSNTTGVCCACRCWFIGLWFTSSCLLNEDD